MPAEPARSIALPPFPAMLDPASSLILECLPDCLVTQGLAGIDPSVL
jgi:hypothetical protein